MAARWRQENYFKYAREHFALDALDSYADQSDDLRRLVPNPAKAYAGDQITAARAQLAAAQGGVADAIDAAGIRARQPGSGGKATVDPAAGQALTAATTDMAAAKAASRQTPSHLPLGQVRPGSRLLETETKLLTHAIRMSAYNAESALARLLRPHYARGDDEARALLREAFTLSGDLQITGDTLHVRLDPASAPRRSNALAALCAQLTDTATRYPGTALTLAYSIKGHPATKKDLTMSGVLESALPPDACDQAASHGFPLSDAEFLVLHARFHLSLAEASGNQVIAATMADLCSSVRRRAHSGGITGLWLA